jgi:hypothetical protein
MCQFFSRIHAKYSRSISFTERSADVLIAYDWPGNVREISNLMMRFSVLFAGEKIDIPSLPPELLPEGLAELIAVRVADNQSSDSCWDWLDDHSVEPSVADPQSGGEEAARETTSSYDPSHHKGACAGQAPAAAEDAAARRRAAIYGRTGSANGGGGGKRVDRSRNGMREDSRSPPAVRPRATPRAAAAPTSSIWADQSGARVQKADKVAHHLAHVVGVDDRGGISSSSSDMTDSEDERVAEAARADVRAPAQQRNMEPP